MKYLVLIQSVTNPQLKQTIIVNQCDVSIFIEKHSEGNTLIFQEVNEYVNSLTNPLNN